MDLDRAFRDTFLQVRRLDQQIDEATTAANHAHTSRDASASPAALGTASSIGRSPVPVGPAGYSYAETSAAGSQPRATASSSRYPWRS
jgi:hypothetical protein